MSVRTKLAKLKKLLLARDSELVVQGVELAVATEDAEILDTLLDGVAYDPERDIIRRFDFWSDEKHQRISGGLEPNKIFSGSGPAQPYHDLALIGLVSLGAAGERAPALRRQITSLIVGCDHSKATPPIPLRLLAGLDHLTDLRIEANADVSDIATLAELRRLRRLQLDIDIDAGITGGLAGLGRSKSLRELKLRSHGLRSLTGLEGTQLETIVLSDTKLVDIEALRGAPIKQLVLEGIGITDVDVPASLPRLRTLVIDGCKHLGGVAGLAGSPVVELTIKQWREGSMSRLEPCDLPRLRRLTVNLSGFESIGDLRGLVALQELKLACWPAPIELRLAQPLPKLKLMDLKGQASIGDARWYPALRELRVQGPMDLVQIAKLEDLERFEMSGTSHERLDHMPAVETPELQLANCRSLVSIRGLGALRGLRRLDLRNCEKLATLAGLEDHPTLELLDLRGCERLIDVSALAGAQSLRAVLASGCPLVQGDFPEPIRWCVSMAKDPNVKGLLARTPPAPEPEDPASVETKRKKRKRGPVPAALMPLWNDIARLLENPSYDNVNEIADRAKEAGAAKLYDALLTGTKFDYNTLVPGRRLGKKPELTKRHLMRRLIAEAPATAKVAAKLRPQITWLYIRGHTLERPRERAPVDLGPLCAFADLESVSAEAEEILGVDALRALPHLKTVHLEHEEPLADLTFAPAGVTELWIKGAKSLAGIERLDCLETLRCAGWRSSAVEDLASLGAARQLTSLDLHCAERADLSPLWELSNLRELSLYAGGLLELSPLSALENLETLTLDCGHRDLTGLRLPRLRTLVLRSPSLESVAGAELPALTAMTVYGPRNLRALGELPEALQNLELHRAPPGADLSAIGRAPSLWRVELDHCERQDLDFVAGGAPIEQVKVSWTGVTDVSGALRCPTLKVLCLYKNTAKVDLAPLAEHPALTEIIVAAKSVNENNTPARVREILRSRGDLADFEAR